MIRKIAIAAVLAGVGLTLASPSHAGSYFYNGKWYYYSLNLEALIAKVTGKDIKDGTFVSAVVTINTADSLCSNPQSHVVLPGKGPKGIVSGSSGNIKDGDLVKKDRFAGNIYQTTATILDLVSEQQRLNPPTIDGISQICKDAPGASQWFPLFWQDRHCNREGFPIDSNQPFCYVDYAAFKDGILVYVTGVSPGNEVPACSPQDECISTYPNKPPFYNKYYNWTFVYLPTTFTFIAQVLTKTSTGETTNDEISGSCKFTLNPLNSQPYSITNPPPNGWAKLVNGEHVFYDCNIVGLGR